MRFLLLTVAPFISAALSSDIEHTLIPIKMKGKATPDHDLHAKYLHLPKGKGNNARFGVEHEGDHHAEMKLKMKVPTLNLEHVDIEELICETNQTRLKVRDDVWKEWPERDFIVVINHHWSCGSDEIVFRMVKATSVKDNQLIWETENVNPYDYAQDYSFDVNVSTELQQEKQTRIEKRWLDQFRMEFDKSFEWDILYDKMKKRMIGVLVLVYADALYVVLCLNCYSTNKVDVKINISPDENGHPKIKANFKRDTFMNFDFILIVRKASEARALNVEIWRGSPKFAIDFPGVLRIGPSLGLETYMMYEFNYGKAVFNIGFDVTSIDEFDFTYNAAPETMKIENHKFLRPLEFNPHKFKVTMDSHYFIRPIFAPFIELSFDTYGKLSPVDIKLKFSNEVGGGFNFMAFENWYHPGLCPKGYLSYDIHKFITYMGVVTRGGRLVGLTPFLIYYEPLHCEWCHGCVALTPGFVPPLARFSFDAYKEDKQSIDDKMLWELRRSGVI